MSEYDALWDVDEPVTKFGIEVPDWIDQDITASNVAAIVQGGCASGAYMPAVTYHQAAETMAVHGDDVLTYIEDRFGCLTAPPDGVSWSGLAVHYLTDAVELWAHNAAEWITAALAETSAS